ncbi:gonadotropin-releasing hormone II receptor-like isoform X2 [Balaenoptera acutorostrata]|uniref:Gonadotropin-releasing hormone II receptor-like isoform X2 n=1 Tax=Balaenoptera acutorostrata TaxID=9767 RepID=A0ABM3T8Q6_BALAC|nr:gonadotropin-releasing hormone II receptor-like isoform X2 [Balaenoptera acutorostrata]XP_057398484.1 gonadotropin-releasing hormone II receptor-like isoform X2 [Balaenoptera acutorostrata]
MPAGNGTPWGSAAGEEIWAGSGVEVEGAELLTFSAAGKVRVGVTVALFVSSAGGNLAVLWSVTRPQPSQRRPSPLSCLWSLGSTARQPYSTRLDPAQLEGNFWGQPGDSFSGLPGRLNVCFIQIQ